MSELLTCSYFVILPVSSTCCDVCEIIGFFWQPVAALVCRWWRQGGLRPSIGSRGSVGLVSEGVIRPGNMVQRILQNSKTIVSRLQIAKLLLLCDK